MKNCKELSDLEVAFEAGVRRGVRWERDAVVEYLRGLGMSKLAHSIRSEGHIPLEVRNELTIASEMSIDLLITNNSSSNER